MKNGIVLIASDALIHNWGDLLTNAGYDVFQSKGGDIISARAEMRYAYRRGIVKRGKFKIGIITTPGFSIESRHPLAGKNLIIIQYGGFLTKTIRETSLLASEIALVFQANGAMLVQMENSKVDNSKVPETE